MLGGALATHTVRISPERSAFPNKKPLCTPELNHSVERFNGARHRESTLHPGTSLDDATSIAHKKAADFVQQLSHVLMEVSL